MSIKNSIILFLLVAILFLTGCNRLSGGYYVYVEPHREESQRDDNEFFVVHSYSEICKAVESFIEEGQESGVVFFNDYDENMLKADLTLMADHVKNKFPLGAYALKNIEYEIGNASNGYAIAFNLSYIHSRNEIKKIQHAASFMEAKDAIYTALSHCDADLTLLVDGYANADIVQIIEDYAMSYPDIVMEIPNVSISTYPETGASRVLELKFNYSTSRDVLRNMKNTVSPIFSSASLYVSGDAESSEKYLQLYAFLSQRYDYRFESSITPAYSLLRHGVGDSKAFAIVYAAMCRNADLACYVVSGTKSGQPYFWNIIQENDTFYHVDIPQSIKEDHFLRLHDDEMLDYVWNYSAYPVCTSDIAESIEIES